MKLLKHSKIDLEQLFNSDQAVTLRLRKKKKGKQVYKELSTRLDSLHKYIPYCYYLLNKIVEYQQLLKTSWYVGLSSKHINKEINSDNRYTAIQILIALSVIDENKHYNYTGEYGKLFPKSYKISSEHISDIVEFEMEVKLCKNKGDVPIINVESGVIGQSCIHNMDSLKCDTFDPHSEAHGKGVFNDQCDTLEDNQLSRIQTNNYDEGIATIPLYHTDYQLKNLKNINYDSVAAFELLEYQKANYLIDLKSRKNLVTDYNRIKFQIQKIKDKNVYFSTGKTGRVTSTVNQIDAEYRSFIKDNDGNDLMEIDFKSSHLNHLLRVIEEDITKGAVKESINKKLLISEIKDLKCLIENGDVYNDFCFRHVKRFGTQILRDKAKELVLENWINCAYENRKLSKWVASIYPTITEYIHTINPEETANGKVKRNRKPLSNRLLTSEARLINELIVGRLAKEFPESVAYTVFDSILIDEDHVDHLYRIMIEESEKYFGFLCKLEMKENDVESKLKKKEKKASVRQKKKIVQTPDSLENAHSRLAQEVKKNMGTSLPSNRSSSRCSLDEATEQLLDKICEELQNGLPDNNRVNDSSSNVQNANAIEVENQVDVAMPNMKEIGVHATKIIMPPPGYSLYGNINDPNDICNMPTTCDFDWG